MKSKCCCVDIEEHFDDVIRWTNRCSACNHVLSKEDVQQETLEEMIERRRDPNTPSFVKPDTYWKVVYECRDAVIYVSPFSDGFFACGQEPLWNMNNITEWIEEVKFE